MLAFIIGLVIGITGTIVYNAFFGAKVDAASATVVSSVETAAEDVAKKI